MLAATTHRGICNPAQFAAVSSGLAARTRVQWGTGGECVQPDSIGFKRLRQGWEAQIFPTFPKVATAAGRLTGTGPLRRSLVACAALSSLGQQYPRYPPDLREVFPIAEAQFDEAVVRRVHCASRPPTAHPVGEPAQTSKVPPTGLDLR